jgi:hypothetical protein
MKLVAASSKNDVTAYKRVLKLPQTGTSGSCKLQIAVGSCQPI